MQKYKVKLTFVRDILGSQPADEDIKKKYIVNKMVTGKTGISADLALSTINEEIENAKEDAEALKELGEKSLTIFCRNQNGEVSIADFQVRGFMKDAFAFEGKAGKLLKKKNGEGYTGDDSYKKWIGERICFTNKYFPIKHDGEVTLLTRPIRCQTMMGPRVSIASSECIKTPATVEVDFLATDDVEKEWLEKIFSRGLFRGLGQWNNAQNGTFTFELSKCE